MSIDELQHRVDELLQSMVSTRTGQKHLAVANALLDGATQAQAWMKVYKSADVSQAAAACSRMLRNGKFHAAEYIQLVSQLASASAVEKLEITQEKVLRNLLIACDRCMQAEPVLDRQGNPVIIGDAEGQLAAMFAFQPMPALRALELLGKELGMFKGGSEKRGPDPITEMLQQIWASNEGRSPLPSGL